MNKEETTQHDANRRSVVKAAWTVPALLAFGSIPKIAVASSVAGPDDFHVKPGWKRRNRRRGLRRFRGKK